MMPSVDCSRAVAKWRVILVAGYSPLFDNGLVAPSAMATNRVT